MASTYLTNTAGTPTNTKIMTFSVWFKIGTQTNQQSLISSVEAASGGSYTDLKIMNAATHNNVFRFECKTTEGNYIDLKFNRSLRDPGAWYHLVISVDTTQTTASDRTKIYINGVQETSFATATYPVQNHNLDFSKSGLVRQIGAYDGGVHWDGSMSHIHFVDGTAYAASTFGSTDSTTGEWTINTSPSVTYGNNGFFVLKDGNTITDSSPNSNNFALAAGTLTKIEDCPDNNFITLNPLNAYYTNSTFSNGNTTFASGSSYSGTTANILLDTGKWYWEVKVISKTGDGDNYAIGIQGQEATGTNQFVGGQLFGYQIYGGNGQIYNNNSGATYAAAYTAGDIIGVALDLTNNKLYYSKNGDWSNGSGAWSSSTFDAAVGAKAITAPATVTLGGYYPSQTFWSGSSGTFSMNFGNGYFGTTAVSSAGTAASTPGIFEYAVPTNYQPLSTKGLNA